MQPVLRFLSAMLKPGLPSTCPRNNQQSPSQLRVKSRRTRLTHWSDRSSRVTWWPREFWCKGPMTPRSDGTSILDDSSPLDRFALEAGLPAPPLSPHLTSSGGQGVTTAPVSQTAYLKKQQMKKSYFSMYIVQILTFQEAQRNSCISLLCFSSKVLLIKGLWCL